MFSDKIKHNYVPSIDRSTKLFGQQLASWKTID